MREPLKKIIAKAPDSAGVYKFLNAKREVIYVGKAKNLKNRLKSYVQKSDERGIRIEKLLENAESVGWIETNNELEALILEDSLIKELQPKYNVLLRDDKNFQYIKVTVADDYPQIETVRRVAKDKAKYFGPKTSGSDVHKLMESVQRIFKLCSVRNISVDPKGVPLPGAKAAVKIGGVAAKRPCLDYHIKRCVGPCAGMVTPAEYRQLVDRAVEFLSGNFRPALELLKQQMTEFARQNKFEQAAKIRDQMAAIERSAEKQVIADTHIVNRDVIAFAEDLGRAFFNLFQIRGGRMLSQEHFLMEGGAAQSLRERRAAEPAELMEAFLRDYYSRATDIPSEIVVSVEVEDPKLLEEYIGKEASKKVKLIRPQAGLKDRLVMLAEKNARSFAEQNRTRWQADEKRAEAALAELQKALRLKNELKRIECYDISHLSGTETVGSMVVFKKGRPVSADYRQFRLKTTIGQIDDFKSISEVLRRRLNHLPAELPEGCHVRRAVKKDISYIEKNWPDLENFEHKHFCVLEKHKKLIAFGRTVDLNDRVQMISALWVNPPDRGSKLGHFIVRKLVDTSKQKRFYVYCNPTLEHYYSMAGFDLLHQPLPELKKRAEFIVKKRKFSFSPIYMAHQKQKKDFSFEAKPDLIVIDGGKGQLSAACAVLDEEGLPIPVISLAKRLEEVYLPGKTEPLLIPSNSEASYLLQRLRDEAHRFAIEYNRSSREKKMVHSALDDIGGVGPKLKKRLLTYFGSVDKIRSASLNELAQIAGEAAARSIKDNL